MRILTLTYLFDLDFYYQFTINFVLKYNIKIYKYIYFVLKYNIKIYKYIYLYCFLKRGVRTHAYAF